MVAISAVGVFCGSSSGHGSTYLDAARHLGELLATEQVELVYGGGRVGLMGALADSCLAAGGRVTGVIPKGLFRREVAHRGVTELHEVASMHERKALMYDRSDAFIALPGGLGTLDELAEVATWSQLGLHAKPLVLLDVDGFWSPFVDLLDGMVTAGLLKAANRALIEVCDSGESALEHLRRVEPTYVEKWIDAEDR
ncbi:MAG: TIGR00730 family Rossman fold protein [Actinomycetota bacterium]